MAMIKYNFSKLCPQEESQSNITGANPELNPYKLCKPLKNFLLSSFGTASSTDKFIVMLNPPIVIPIIETPIKASKKEGLIEIEMPNMRQAKTRRRENIFWGVTIPHFGSQYLAERVEMRPVRELRLKR